MSMDRPAIERIRREVAPSLHEHWVLYLVEGIVLVILGIAAIVVPQIATLAVEILFGWLLLLSGVAGLATTLRMQHAPGFWWSLVSAILGVATGAVLLMGPLDGILSLSVILILFFAIESMASIMLAVEHQRRSEQWGWMLLSGIIDLVLFILATAILVGFPGTAAWLLGILLGVCLIIGGLALVATALHARA
jgi:uncharacterized membrane protein HdeD (DUF308 family)